MSLTLRHAAPSPGCTLQPPSTFILSFPPSPPRSLLSLLPPDTQIHTPPSLVHTHSPTPPRRRLSVPLPLLRRYHPIISLTNTLVTSTMHPRTLAPATRRQYGEVVPKGAEEVSRYLKRGRLGGGTTELSQVRLLHPPHTHTHTPNPVCCLYTPIQISLHHAMLSFTRAGNVRSQDRLPSA